MFSNLELCSLKMVDTSLSLRCTLIKRGCLYRHTNKRRCKEQYNMPSQVTDPVGRYVKKRLLFHFRVSIWWQYDTYHGEQRISKDYSFDPLTKCNVTSGPELDRGNKAQEKCALPMLASHLRKTLRNYSEWISDC